MISVINITWTFVNCLCFRSHITFNWFTCTNQVSVTMCIVYAADRRPEFILRNVIKWKSSCLSRVRMFPIIAGDDKLCMWSMFQWIVFFVKAAFFNGPDLVADGQQCITEAIQFSFVFTFCRFDHYCSGYREAHSGCMKPIIDQPFCNIFGVYL